MPAEIFTDEGLDTILGVLPKNGTNFSSLFMGLFTSQTSTTVPARTATLGAAPAGVTEETSAGAYARVAIPAANWGAPATNGSGRRITATTVSFPQSTGAWGAAVNGFFLATTSAAGASDKGIFFSNFSDDTAVTVNAAGFTIQVTPYWHYDG